MFKVPERDKITIMGKDIPIIKDDHKLDLAEADGLYEAETIYLREEYSDYKEFRRIFSHEAFHALCEILGIQLDIHVEEILAHRVSTMFGYEF